MPTPPSVEGCNVSFPSPSILLVTIDREKHMNSLPFETQWQMHELFTWFDEEPDLQVAVITGAGKKAFCAGQDLKELKTLGSLKTNDARRTFPHTGFAGISTRVGKKPIIAAVNGLALGGGMETALNCDMVVASPNARFGLTEPNVGVYAAAGGLPRLVRLCGLHIASQIALTGQMFSAQKMEKWGIVNQISRTPESVVEEALELAAAVTKVSPDSAIVTRAGLRMGWEEASVDKAFARTAAEYDERLFKAPNTAEGMTAFGEKRPPRWTKSVL